jgi:TPP-dependent pyruvate/acetoin dehydrogenase alpha subunit
MTHEVPMAASDLSRDDRIRLHKGLLRVRCAEEVLAEVYKQQEMRTPTHFGIGQEAVAVGVCEALREGDLIYSHHRCHTHYLAKGGSLVGLAAELYGRVNGCSRGRGGSVHLNDPGAGVVATAAILGGTVAAAVGSALAFAMDGVPRVAVCFFGDAAMEEGTIYECLNFAAIRKLPVLFVCENNGYSTESPLRVRQPAGTELCDRVRAFKVRAEKLDGNEVYAVHAAALDALAACRGGTGPVFLECLTYRWREHVGPYFDHELGRTYRNKEEVESWVARCPLKRSGESLAESGIATTEDLEQWRAEIEQQVRQRVAEAGRSPWPDPQSLLEDVY